jgi:hypothetical protein
MLMYWQVFKCGWCVSRDISGVREAAEKVGADKGGD